MKKYNVLFILGTLLLISVFVLAQEDTRPDQKLQTEVTAQSAQVAEYTMKPAVPGTITFSFKDADIRNVMRLIAAKAGINVVYGPEVTGVVNMELRDVPWEQALNLVLDLNGYACQKEGNVIKVLSKDQVAKEPLSTEVFILNYSTASDVAESVKQMLSERGSIKTDTRSNTIIVTDIPANINKIEMVLKRLDSRTMQVLIETKIIEVRDTLEKEIGIKWTSLKEYELTFGGLSRTFKSIRRGGRGQWDTDTQAVKTDGTTDTNVNQDTTQTSYGNYNDLIEGTSIETSRNNLADAITHTITDTFSKTMLNGDIRTALLSAADFKMVLSALQEDANTDLLSNPKVMSANNEKAEIKIVSEYPVPNYEFDTETSQWAITGFEKEEIGVIFHVTPNISMDGFISMRMEPEVSTMIDLVPFTAGGATVLIPYVGRKKASTKLVMKSGDTLAIGGLIDEDKVNTVTKVPLLGDIPVVGRLFRHEQVNNVKKNIIFFITATIIDEESKSIILQDDEEADYDQVRNDYNSLFKKPNPAAGDDQAPAGNQGFIINTQKGG